MKYKNGEALGPYKIILLKRTKVTSYGHHYGLFKCPICGEPFESKIYHITSGATKQCKKCKQNSNSGRNNANFKDLTGKRYGKLTVINYIGAKKVGKQKNGKILTQSLWECKCDCGNIIERTTNVLERNNVNCCPECSISSIGEEKIKNILQELNIDYISQYRFNDCKDVKTLPFDFYLPDYNTLIEYDGLGHYKANPYGSWRTTEIVEKTKKHDKMKNDYCIANNIKLIRIPYFDYNKINKNYLKQLIYS